MSGYIGINLKDIISDESMGESAAKSILSSFSCPLNPDIEYFLKNVAIEFAKQGISNTYLIMALYKSQYVLVGYFTLANKVFCINKTSLPNRKWRSRISKFRHFNNIIQRYTLSAPLIGQVGKNFTNNYNKLITGDELLKLALDQVRQIQNIVGGKLYIWNVKIKKICLIFIPAMVLLILDCAN